LTSEEKSTITNLTVTGNIDARDFKTMKDSMPWIETIDLSGTVVQAYTGTNGTAGSSSITYAANVVPEYAFSERTRITSVSLPSGITSIGNYAFNNDYGLTEVVIPNGVTEIGSAAFYNCRMTSIDIPSSVKIIRGMLFTIVLT